MKDASALLGRGRYDGAVYLCGYAVEVAMKARVCRNLRWTEFPDTPNEWQKHHQFLKVHELERLVKYTGLELRISNPPFGPHWLQVKTWNPESRYRLTGAVTQAQARQMIQSTRLLMNLLLPR